MSDPRALRDLAIQIAHSIAPELRSRTGQAHTLLTKSSNTDLVSDVDLWSEERITTMINSARPDDEIISEEGTRIHGSSGVRWLVDPIDGTTNFIYGHHGFSISIGVEIDGEPMAGVVMNPLNGEVFAAAHGSGATRNGNLIQVNTLTDLSQALVATGFGYTADRRRSQAEALLRTLPQIRDIRRMGGAALDLASVSCGRVDAFFERGLAPWDVAAGLILVTEAGGRVVTQQPLSGSTPATGANSSKRIQNTEENPLLIAAGVGIIDALTELLLEAGAHQGP